MTPAELAALIRAVLLDAVAAGDVALAAEDVPEPKVERPRQREHGDWATNVAMQLAKKVGTNPRALAELLAGRLAQADGIAAAEVAGPGFLNIRLEAGAAGELARTIVETGPEFGRNDALTGHVINMEYVSANPTGPLHIGHTRWAALGDALVRLLRASGADVTPEYYINDAGAQMDKFGASILARATGGEVPEGGYIGGYVNDLAARVLAVHPELPDLPVEEAVAVAREAGYRLQMAEIEETLAAFNVHFDVYFSERELHDGGAVRSAVDRLREQGHVFDDGGAVWLRTTDFGDDKDRVMVRADGAPTYFAADAAYYLSKKDRGFPEKIYLLGADHHGYVNRLKAIASCAGDDPERNIEILIGQLVSVAGARMSKRAGNIIELRDLIEWIGTDPVRYTLARFPADSPLTLDGEKLREQNLDNPVYYVQYAHARTRQVARNAETHGVSRDGFDPTALDHPADAALLGVLGSFPEVVARAARLREPHRVARYLEELAASYHTWYGQCRVTPRGEDPVEPSHHARLVLNDAVTQVIANGLGLLGVSAPERM
ncbi:arginine--tRNA ligase [Georgenia yuyongxinii]|uniref:Arginine--tRNA ligase n=1 Tax=Georgenia yuyongxinii TaxID=2589797 RepID=A0A5B8C5X5_9MICO|nr:arginine--tRNA ligase [Georgenia yuyongxinii]QDC25490.1 arginine--tRNA ligase [Georgenia yuyongxinii]